MTTATGQLIGYARVSAKRQNRQVQNAASKSLTISRILTGSCGKWPTTPAPI
jgi:hypothetical protein